METNKVRISNCIATRRLDPIFYRCGISRFGKIFKLTRVGLVVSSMQSGFAAGKENQATAKDGIIQVRPTNIDTEGELIFDKNIYIPADANRPMLMKEDIVFNNTNSQELVGKSAMIRENKSLFFSNHITRIRVNKSMIIPDYLCIILNVYQREKIFFSICTNWNNQSGVNIELLKSVEIPLPPLPTQQKIVDIYNKAKREKQEKEKESQRLLDEIETYLLAQLGIEPPKEQQVELMFKVKASTLIGGRYNPFSYSAKTAMLQELITSSPIKKKRVNEMLVLSSAGDWGTDEDEADVKDFIRCLVIRSTEFDNQYNLNLDSSRVKYRMVKRDKLEKMDLQEGDILVEKSGGSEDQPVGRVALLTSDMLQENTLSYSNFIHKIRLDKAQVNPEYAFYFLRTMYRIGMTESMQSQTNGIRNLSMPSFLKQYLLLPDNQEEITEQINHKYAQARKNQEQAKRIILEAKEQIERIILSKI